MDIVVAAEAQQEGKTVDHKADSKTTTQTEENGTADKQTEKATQVKSGKTTEAVTEKTVGETSQETSEEKSDANPDNITLSAGDRVFFAGDSLMQGVAPHMRKWLKSRYQINSIDLSKQSTGLSYPSFFNWPETIEKQLVKDSHIKLLIVFLGPNDPWAFPNPDKKGGTYLKFKSDGWERVYRQRVDRIVQAARKSKAKLIWLGIPYMKKRKLNRQMRYLDKLLADELKGKVLWLPTAKLLSGGRDRYHASAKVNGKNVRMRSKDGIHFTISGQKQIAKYIMEHINFNQSE
ncbi:MAG: hypothetical protein CSA45_03765 [Gammaproteobacteria bacterium]|nr:MAG: hypothetical protein CSA45_03765 [Gammaproteobacteria bacterium]